MTTAYRHRFIDGSRCDLPVGKVVCVGRNYAEHARELGNPLPTEPLLFLKPPGALVPLEDDIALPSGRGPVHHELELALLNGDRQRGGSAVVAGAGLALDLTLRERQQRLKRDGHPWDTAKGFAGACPCSRFISAGSIADWRELTFELRVNDQRRQTGRAADMLFDIPALLGSMDYHFGLDAGDVVLTGTPAGTGALAAGDRLSLRLPPWLEVLTRIAG